jgi:hypothetical protein
MQSEDESGRALCRSSYHRESSIAHGTQAPDGRRNSGARVVFAIDTLTSSRTNPLPHLSRQPTWTNAGRDYGGGQGWRIDPKVANTVAYVGTVLLLAYEADPAPCRGCASSAIR